jgi:hypothetical protein
MERTDRPLPCPVLKRRPSSSQISRGIKENLRTADPADSHRNRDGFLSPRQELYESRVPVDCFWFSDFDFREVGMCRI